MSLKFESDSASKRKAIADAAYKDAIRTVRGQAKAFAINGKIAREKAGQRTLIGCFRLAAGGILFLVGIKLLPLILK